MGKKVLTLLTALTLLFTSGAFASGKEEAGKGKVEASRTATNQTKQEVKSQPDREAKKEAPRKEKKEGTKAQKGQKGNETKTKTTQANETKDGNVTKEEKKTK